MSDAIIQAHMAIVEDEKEKFDNAVVAGDLPAAQQQAFRILAASMQALNECAGLLTKIVKEKNDKSNS